MESIKNNIHPMNEACLRSSEEIRLVDTRYRARSLSFSDMCPAQARHDKDLATRGCADQGGLCPPDPITIEILDETNPVIKTTLPPKSPPLKVANLSSSEPLTCNSPRGNRPLAASPSGSQYPMPKPNPLSKKPAFEIVHIDDLLGRVDRLCRDFESETRAIKYLMDVIIAATTEDTPCKMYSCRGNLCVRFDKQHFLLMVKEISQDLPLKIKK